MRKIKFFKGTDIIKVQDEINVFIEETKVKPIAVSLNQLHDSNYAETTSTIAMVYEEPEKVINEIIPESEPEKAIPEINKNKKKKNNNKKIRK